MANTLPQIPQSPEPEAVSTGMPTPYDSTHVTPDEAGIGNAVGDAAQKGISDVSRIYAKAKGDADASAVVGTLTDVGNVTTDKLYGYTDKNGQHTPGFYELKGENAFAQSGKLLDDLEKDRLTARAGLTDDQAAVYDKLTLAQAAKDRESIEKYANEQLQVAHKENYQAADALGIKRVTNLASVGNDTEAISDAIDSQTRIINAQAHTLGIDPAAMVADWRMRASETALSSIMARVDNDDDPDASAYAAQQAQDFFNAHKADLVDPSGKRPDNVKNWADTVKKVADSADISAQTNQMLSDHIDANGNVNMIGIQKDFAAMPESDKKNAIEDHVLRAAANAVKLQSEAAAGISKQLLDLGTNPKTGFFSMPKSPAAVLLMQQLREKDPTGKAVSDLAAYDQRSLRNELATVAAETHEHAAQAKAELDIAKNHSTINVGTLHLKGPFAAENRDLADKMTSEEFGQSLLDEEKYPGGFTPADQKKAIGDFENYKKQLINADNKVVETPGALAKGVLEQTYKGTGAAAVVNRTKLMQPMIEAQEQYIQSHTAADGRKPKPEDVQKYLNDELATGRISHTGFMGIGKTQMTRAEFEYKKRLGALADEQEFQPDTAPEVSMKNERDKLPPGSQYRRKGDPTGAPSRSVNGETRYFINGAWVKSPSGAASPPPTAMDDVQSVPNAGLEDEPEGIGGQFKDAGLGFVSAVGRGVIGTERALGLRKEKKK